MHSIETILTLMAAQLVIAMTPGPSTVFVLQNALRDRKLGFAAAAGLFPAGVLWAVFGLCGLGTLFSIFPKLANVMSALCGAYLIWLGVKSILSSFKLKENFLMMANSNAKISDVIRMGFITNISNPKTIAYYASIFAATGAAAMPYQFQILAIVMMLMVSFGWLCTLIMLVSHPVVRNGFEKSRHWLDRIAGFVMLGFGISLLVALIS